jgi:hypothetical protein
VGGDNSGNKESFPNYKGRIHNGTEIFQRSAISIRKGRYVHSSIPPVSEDPPFLVVAMDSKAFCAKSFEETRSQAAGRASPGHRKKPKGIPLC